MTGANGLVQYISSFTISIDINQHLSHVEFVLRVCGAL